MIIPNEVLFDPGNQGGPGFESQAPPECDITTMTAHIYSYSFYETVSRSNNIASTSNPSNLPCANNFLLFGNIIHFNTTQIGGIQSYDFDGAAIHAVTLNNGDVYSNALKHDVIGTTYTVLPTNNLCGNDFLYQNTEFQFVNKRNTYQFVCFPKIAQSGYASIEGSPLGDYSVSITGFLNVLENTPGYSFTIPTPAIVPANVGDQVVGKTKAGLYYCITLTQEDINRGLKSERDKKYLPTTIEIKLDHPINLPSWAREFFEAINILELSPCAIQHINAGLDALHNSLEYQQTPSESIKSAMEYKSLAYDAIFGVLYCATDENAAEGLPCAQQYALGLLHEAIGSIDIAQMRDGIIKMANGLGSFVLQNVKDLTNGVKDVIVDHTNGNPINYEEITKQIIAKNNSILNSIYNKAAAMAQQFKQMYFTNCGNICCYRDGELTMMVLPIIFTAGDYAVIKLEALAIKYGARAADAIKMIADAERLGAKVINDVDKILIKESDDVDALVISTQEKVANDITISGEQNLDNIIDANDLKEVDVPNPVVNNEIVANQGNKANGWNKRLSKPLEPNKIYKVGNKKYHTDATGRVKKVTCDNLILNPNDANKYQQSFKCRKVKDAVAGDDGGHLIGKQFNGAGEQINYVPMKSSINQNPGSWYNMEQEWRNTLLQPGGTVTDIEINITYGATKRPTGFTVSARINGASIKTNYLHTN
jgi:DNA/RNA non-specific endonuclease